MFLQKQLRWAMVAAALPGVFPAEPQQAQGPVRLVPGTPLTRPIEGSAVDRLVVTLATDQFVKVIVMQTGSDVVATLRDPRGDEVMNSALPNGEFGAETVAAVADSAGDYAVEVKLSNPRAPKGSYEVTLEAVRDASQTDRELAAAYGTLSKANVLRKARTPETRREAIDLMKQAVPVFAETGDRYTQAWTLIMVWSMLADSGDIRTALTYAEEAASLFQAVHDSRGEARACNVAGGMLDVLGEPQKALEQYRRALALSRADGNREQEAQELNNIGKTEGDAGNWQTALDDYRQALELAVQTSSTALRGAYTHNIGTGYWRVGDYEAAVTTLEDALRLRREAQDRRGEADTLQVIGATYLSWKQAAKALEPMQQALAIEVSLGDRRREAEIRRDLGRVYAGTGKLPEAEESLRKSVEGERAAQDRRNVALGLRDLSNVLRLENKPVDALAAGEEALRELRALGDVPSQAAVLEAIARAEAVRGNLAAARDRMEESLRLTEETRTKTDSEQFRASFLATREDSYSFYIDLLMQSGKTAEALEASERARARSLLDMLADSGADIREGVDTKLLARERELTALLNAKGARLLPLMGRDTPRATALKEEIRNLETEYQDVEAAIRKSSPRYAALTHPEPLKLAEIQDRVLDEDSLLLEYSMGETRSFLWAVGKKSVGAFVLPGREKIEAAVAEVSDLLTARSAVKRMETAAERDKRIAAADAALPDAARRLSEMVLAPAAAALEGKRLVLAPDGALQRLPFAMLPAPGSSEPIVAAHEVVVLPSASALAALRSETAGRAPAPKMLAVFADPVFDAADPRAGHAVASAAASTAATSTDSTRILQHLAAPGEAESATLKIPRLPFTAQEADQILRVARGGQDWRAEGFAANRAAAISGQLSQYRYIHFATHGVLDTEHPSLSALVLSQIDESRKPQDGFLRVNDIYNMRLSADLVVLSACQTGLGKEIRGEGLMGLSRAFLYAGAPRVVVSLWNVNDRATAALMADLYRGMLRGGMTPSVALRAAQLELRKQKRWESPYYWAAFVQYGEWR